MKKLTMILVALAAMLALAAPAMAADCAALSGQAEEDCWTRGAQKEFAAESNPTGIPQSVRADASASASASSSASASATATPSASSATSASPEATASASAAPNAQQQYSAPEKPSATLPETGGPRLLLILSGLAIVTGGALFGYIVRKYS